MCEAGIRELHCTHFYCEMVQMEWVINRFLGDRVCLRELNLLLVG